MNIIILQSCDDEQYIDMFDVSNQTVQKFCVRHGIPTEAYIGVKRGYKPWHAMYNRIVMIKNLLDSGYRGWILWLDADAFIRDFDFDLKNYLGKNEEKSLIIVNSGASPEKWDVNDGVFMLNLGRHFGRLVALSWYLQFMSITDEQLRNSENWHSVPDDQVMLQWHLKKQSNLDAEIHYEDWSFMNSTFASFVRQIMRSEAGDFAKRIE